MARDDVSADQQEPLLSENRRGEYQPIGGANYEGERRKLRKTKAQKCLHTVAFIFLGGLFVAAIIILAILLVRVGGQSPRVTVTCGEIQGSFDVFKTVYSFKAIPYAAPPVGLRRWKPPQPLTKETCWEDVYNAENYRNVCPQRDPTNQSYIGSEDCLVLDVFTPTLDSRANLPVMVYIHGGYLRFGDSHMPGYYADKNLAAKLNAVFVNIQYRVGTMGFLVLDALDGSTGNYGFLDQIQALKWVQENIALFGGNKNSVTIYGQSSGGSSVLNLMISPLAKGLFHRAWSSSGSVLFNATLDEARVKNKFFIAKVGCNKSPDIKKCLYEVPAENATMATFGQDPRTEWGYGDAHDIPHNGHTEAPLAVIDGIVFKAGLLESFQSKEHLNRIPLIIGTTAQEADVMPDIRPPYDLDIAKWTEETYKNYVSEHLDTFSKAISAKALKLYPNTHDPELPLTTMITDVRITCATDVLAQAAANALPGMVYRYVVTSWPSSSVSAFGMPFNARYAFHLWDIFGFFDSVGLYMNWRPSRSDYSFAETVQTNMMHFAKTGKVADPSWLTYNASIGLIADKVKVVSSYQKDECEFWLSNGFFDYSWMN